jgi:hypothetical protein
MILVTATYNFALGKGYDGLAYLRRTIARITTLTGVPHRLLVRSSGPVGTFVVGASYADAAAWDAARHAINADPEVIAIVGEADKAGLFVGGSLEISQWDEL